MVVTILSFIALLALLVLAHEWGHFFAARRLGVGVEEFGFGFPPRIAGFRRGQTTYTVNWVPLGGFVKLKGEAGGERTADSFVVQPAWRRAVILVAGVFMNVLLAAALLAVGFMVGFPAVLSENQATQARNVQFEVVSVAPSSPAAQAGLQAGDTLLTVDGRTFQSVSDFQAYVAVHRAKPVGVTYLHNGSTKTAQLTPQSLPETNGRPVLGVGLLPTGIITYPWYQALGRGAAETWRLGREILAAFGNLFQNLIVHHEVPQNVAGPIGIAVITGQVARLGFIYLLQFAALLSLNLAIINIFPFPALDGGRLLFVIIEKLRRKPNNERVVAIVHQIGFTVLIALVLLVTYRDVARLSGDFFTRLWGA